MTLMAMNNGTLMGVIYMSLMRFIYMSLMGYIHMSLIGVRLYVTYWGTLICHSLRVKGLGYLFYYKYPKKFGAFLTNNYFCKKH